MKKICWLVSLTTLLLVILVFPGQVFAVENSDTFSVPFMQEPELSVDGLTLYNAQTIGIVVVDPNPSPNQVRIPAPDRLMEASTATSTFQFAYLEAGQTDLWGETCYTVPEDTKAAFNQAGIIWGNLLQSSVPISIQVCWGSLASESMLGYSGGGPLLRDFTNAPRPETWYAGSLANSLAGTDLDTSKYDMYITFNKNFAWYTGTDANPPADLFDLESVALHEICHGLNFTGSMLYASGVAYWGYKEMEYPNIYDTYMRDGSGNSLIETSVYANKSSALGSAVTSNDLWFHGPQAMSGNGGSRVKMYAPTTWKSGSSYSHLDYDTFVSGNNRLMRYAIAKGTAIHDPGPVAMGILKDLGWKTGGTAECLPGIKANGQDGPITVSSNTPVSITVSLAPGNQDGKSADWWLVYASPLGLYSLTSNGWSPGINPLATYPLLSIPPVEILNEKLTAGDYAFYFAVDMNPNGLLDLPLYYDWVEVHVINPTPTPTPMPTPTPTLRAGTWSGSNIQFNVSSDGTKITSTNSSIIYNGTRYAFTLGPVYGSVGSCSSVKYTSYISGDVPITNNAFSMETTSNSVAISGNFPSTITSTGNYSVNYFISQCGGSLISSGSWSATPSASSSSSDGSSKSMYEIQEDGILFVIQSD